MPGVAGLRSQREHLGTRLIPYEQGWELQRAIHAQRVAGTIDDVLLLLEHEAVYTAGKRTEPSERPVLTAGAAVVDVDRGGKITWHGPGQLVGYPIVALPEPLDVVGFVRRIEELIIRVCADLGLRAIRIDGRSGVWVPRDGDRPDRKVGAIGIRVSQRVTMHGFAINCTNDLTWFDTFVPCGITDAGVTSLSAELGREVGVLEVADRVERHCGVLSAVPSGVEQPPVPPTSRVMT